VVWIVHSSPTVRRMSVLSATGDGLGLLAVWLWSDELEPDGESIQGPQGPCPRADHSGHLAERRVARRNEPLQWVDFNDQSASRRTS